METSKIIGKIIQLAGILIVIIGLANKNPAGGFGVLVSLFGRAIDEYWDEWFG